MADTSKFDATLEALRNVLIGILPESLQPEKRRSVMDPSRELETVARDLIPSFVASIGQMLTPESPTDFIPGSKALSVASQLGGSSSETEAAITKGGRKDLFATHYFSPMRLARLIEAADAVPINPSMDLMSYAIEKNPSRNIFGSAALIPKPDVIDPVNSRLIKLWNRDAYTGTVDPDMDIVEQYVKSRPGAFVQGIPNMDHALAIAASPRFKSFKEFEESPQGAKTLDKPVREIDNIHEYLWELGISKKQDPAEVLKQLSESDKKLAQAIYKRYQTQGSEYAEGKVEKPLALTGQNFLAAIMGAGDMQAYPDLVKRLKDSGIKVGTETDFIKPEQVKDVKAKVDKYMDRYNQLVDEAILNNAAADFPSEILLLDKAKHRALMDEVKKDTYGAASRLGPWTSEPSSLLLPELGIQEQIDRAQQMIMDRFLYSPSFNVRTKALESITEDYLNALP